VYVAIYAVRDSTQPVVGGGSHSFAAESIECCMQETVPSILHANLEVSKLYAVLGVLSRSQLSIKLHRASHLDDWTKSR